MKHGGQTVIMRRNSEMTDFYRNWTEYKVGFGQPSQNHWIGNFFNLMYIYTYNNLTQIFSDVFLFRETF